jgi:hypothetical protein
MSPAASDVLHRVFLQQLYYKIRRKSQIFRAFEFAPSTEKFATSGKIISPVEWSGFLHHAVLRLQASFL